MSSERLLQARNYELIYGSQIQPEERPLFHVSPTVGWLNDPNGFSFYQGKCHLFYQYHPYSTEWGPMHWGHLTTEDFIRWERLPAATAPDERYDKDGCFSGSAVELPDGRQLLMYTGVEYRILEDGSKAEYQTQCIAYGDGLNYEKYPNNPVLSGADLPEGASTQDFRDPKVWRDEAENCYYAVVGSRPADGSGSIVLFRSEDTKHWQRVTVLDGSRNEYGRMWECPDFFPLDGMQLIFTSPQEMRARGMEFHNGNGVIYLTGQYDAATHRFKRESVQALEYGLDFYAPQTVLTKDGRRVMIAWMQSWETSRFVLTGAKWFGMMTIPRELSLRDGKLIQQPVRELEHYRTDRVVYRDVDVHESCRLPQLCGRTLDMTLKLRPAGTEMYRSFTMTFAQDNDHAATITYRPGEGSLCIDRSDSGFRYDIVTSRKAPIRDRQGELELRVVLDRFSVELFVNGGEQAMSACIYTPQSADGISFHADGYVRMDVEKYNITM